MKTPPTLGQRLRALRKRRGESQDQVADAVGISRSYLAGIETDHDKPGFDSFVALADYYGVSLDWLAKGHGDPGDDEGLQEIGMLRQILRFLYEGPAPARRRQLARQLLAEMDAEEGHATEPEPEPSPPKGGRR